MAVAPRPRPWGLWIVVAVLAVAAAVLGFVIVTGLGIADEAGRPLGVPAVAVTPGPQTTPSPQPTDAPTVVEAPPPVTVQLDDHGGDRVDNSGSGSSDDNSGKGGGSDD